MTGTVVKTLGIAAAVLVLGVSLVAADWYRFATHAPIDPMQGIYADPHLEVWIDINRWMPAPVRAWGCKQLMDRHATPVMPPYGCTPARDGMAALKSIVAKGKSGMAYEARRNGATPEQTQKYANCVEQTILAAIPATDVAAFGTATDEQIIPKIIAVAGVARETCQRSSGF